MPILPVRAIMLGYNKIDFTPGARGTWRPTDVAGLTLWYDYSDSATITLVSGAISQITDKSASGMTLTQGTAAARPTLVAADQNGLDVASFDGSNDLLAKTSGVSGVPANSQSAFSVIRSSSSTSGWVYYSDNGSVLSAGNLAGSAGTRYQGNSNNFSTALSSIAYHVFSGYMVTTRREGFEDGVAAAASTVTETAAAVPTRISMGANAGGATLYTGKIGEFFQYNSQVSAQDRQRAEGDLAWKWGLQGLLASTHPYKLGGPNKPAT